MTDSEKAMDPVSITASILTITQAISQIYSLAKTVKDSKTEIKHLCDELYALKGVLEHVQMQFTAPEESSSSKQLESVALGDVPDVLKSPKFGEMLESTQTFIADLLRGLPETKGIKSALKRFAWPWTKDQIKEHIARLERVKSWFMFAMLDDTVGQTTKCYNEVQRLARSFNREKKARALDQQHHIVDRIGQWLAPVSTSATHAKACVAYQAHTGLWFLNGDFEIWQNAQSNTTLCLLGKSGSGKTVMTSSAVEKTRKIALQDVSVGLAYFYCAFNNVASQEPANILGSLLVSLCHTKPHLLFDFEPQFRQSK